MCRLYDWQLWKHKQYSLSTYGAEGSNTCVHMQEENVIHDIPCVTAEPFLPYMAPGLDQQELKLKS